MAEITPDFFVKGSEYEDKIEPRHLEYFRQHSIDVRFTHTPKFSSTTLLSDLLDSVKDFKVLLVGDMIVDEYVYVRTVGKAIKESALSAMIKSKESFLGGVWAAAEHVRQFCDPANVHLWVGQNRMWNSRLVDDIYFRKLFVTHEVLPGYEREWTPNIKSYDVVIVCDFGHGALTKERIELLCRDAKFLAVNSQTNATNYGFNLITKYRRADLIVLDELEARLAVHDRESPIEKVIVDLGYPNTIITRGIHGAIGLSAGSGTSQLVRQESVTDKVLDSMGAGDAFFAITSLFAATGISMDNLIKVGNIAGAIKCGIIGHRSAVTKEEFSRWLAK